MHITDKSTEIPRHDKTQNFVQPISIAYTTPQMRVLTKNATVVLILIVNFNIHYFALYM